MDKFNKFTNVCLPAILLFLSFKCANYLARNVQESENNVKRNERRRNKRKSIFNDNMIRYNKLFLYFGECGMGKKYNKIEFCF